MSSPALLLAAISLVPAMTGPLAGGQAREIAIALCNGGSISIPLEQGPTQGDENGAHCAKGCHSTRPRKSVDRAQ